MMCWHDHSFLMDPLCLEPLVYLKGDGICYVKSSFIASCPYLWTIIVTIDEAYKGVCSFGLKYHALGKKISAPEFR